MSAFFIQYCMDSSEVLKTAISSVGVKSVAVDMNLSASLIYKWCQPNDHADNSGADNPLDRLLLLYKCTKDPRIINWLCHQADGFFVKKPSPVGDISSEVFDSTQKILKEFSDMLNVVSMSYSNDKKIDNSEAHSIREAWEDLKSIGETFVMSCEAGHFDDTKTD